MTATELDIHKFAEVQHFQHRLWFSRGTLPDKTWRARRRRRACRLICFRPYFAVSFGLLMILRRMPHCFCSEFLICMAHLQDQMSRYLFKEDDAAQAAGWNNRPKSGLIISGIHVLSYLGPVLGDSAGMCASIEESKGTYT